MSVICSTSCGAIPDIDPSYYNCVDQFREYGANHFLLIKCDYNFTDLLDPTEWTTAIQNGDIIVSPPGQLIGQAPTQSIAEVEGCRREVVAELQYTYDFTTLQTADPEGDIMHKDYEFWNKIFKNASAYRIVMVTCDCRFYMDNELIDALKTGTPPATLDAEVNPGFEFSLTAAPYIAENTELRSEQWTTQFRIRRTFKEGILRAADMSAVCAAIL